MGTGYTRKDTSNNIANGNVIDADDIDAEFNGVEDAFNSSTGHTHDGTSAEGAPIEVTGPSQEYVSDATALYPKADNAYDLGKTGSEWKDLYIDGTANIDTLTADAGTVGGSNITTTDNTQTLTNKTIDSATNTVTVDLSEATVTGTLSEFNTALSDDNFVSLTGSETLTNKTLTSPDINGGTIDGTVIGGTTPAAGSFTTFTSTGIDDNATSTAVTLNSSGNVGIGTSSPARALHVNSGPTDVTALLESTDATNWLSFWDSVGGVSIRNLSGAMQFFTNGTSPTGGDGSEAMRIDSSGNVGIGGITNPQRLLSVGANDWGLDYSSNLLSLTQNNTSLGVVSVGGIGTTKIVSDTNNNGTGDVVFETGAEERMRIDSSGNVGIGTSSPSATLDVNGSLSKNSGSFKIDHPVKPDTHHLVHSFVEGPQADNLYRGKVTLVDGQATVNLDEAGRMTEGTFVALNGNVQCFTTNEDGWTQVRGSVAGNILTIEAQDPVCADEVSWLVIGERHDQHMIETEWTDENGRVITEPEKTLKGQ